MEDSIREANKLHCAPIIAIGRQFGSGGRALGRSLANRLGLKFYDKELLDEATKRYGLDTRLLRKADERRPSLLHSILGESYGWASSYIGNNAMGVDGIYKIQSSTIRQLASEGGAVFIGRTADYVLRDYPGLISIFLHSDEKSRIERIMERGECSNEADALEKAKKIDKLREGYYNYFTGRQWGKADNYNLSISTSFISADDLADIITHFISKRQKCFPDSNL